MDLDCAIRLARVWAFGGVCSLKEGEAQEYHKLALAALEALRDGAVPVVRCRECKHGSSGVLDVNCYHPEYDLCEGVTPHEPEFFCAYGERKDGDGNG